jgi:hypothetical protein
MERAPLSVTLAFEMAERSIEHPSYIPYYFASPSAKEHNGPGRTTFFATCSTRIESLWIVHVLTTRARAHNDADSMTAIDGRTRPSYHGRQPRLPVVAIAEVGKPS